MFMVAVYADNVNELYMLNRDTDVIKSIINPSAQTNINHIVGMPSL